MPVHSCKDLENLKVLLPEKYFCEECVKINARWIHLRKCQTCGTTLCCDSSPHQHATKHHHTTGHPVIISAEPGEYWAWCFLHHGMINYRMI
jgi:hypothetical protein